MSTSEVFFEDDDEQETLQSQVGEIDKFSVYMSTLLDHKFESGKAPEDWSKIMISLYNNPDRTKILSALTQALNLADRRKSTDFIVLDKNMRFSSNSVAFKPKDHRLSDFLDKVFGRGTFLFLNNAERGTMDVCFLSVETGTQKVKSLKFGYFQTKFAIGNGSQVGQQFTDEQANLDLTEVYKRNGENVTYLFLKPDLQPYVNWYDPGKKTSDGKFDFPDYYCDLPFAKLFHSIWNKGNQRKILHNPPNANFYMVLSESRRVRLSDPGNLEHSSYTVFPHIPDKSIHPFSNLFYLQYFKKEHNINVTHMSTGDKQDPDLYRVNGYIETDWHMYKMINVEKTDIDFFYSHSKEVATVKEFEELKKQWDYIKGKKIIKMYMPRNSDVLVLLVNYCVAEGFSPFMSETPHNGLIYLAQIGNKNSLEEFIQSYTIISVAGIELNFMRTYHFVKRSSIAVIEKEVKNEFYTYVRIKKSIFKLFEEGFIIKNSSVVQMKNMNEVLNYNWENLRKREYHDDSQNSNEVKMKEVVNDKKEEVKMDIAFPDSTTIGWQLALFELHINGYDVFDHVRKNVSKYKPIVREQISSSDEFETSGQGFLDEYSKLFPIVQDNKKQKLEGLNLEDKVEEVKKE